MTAKVGGCLACDETCEWLEVEASEIPGVWVSTCEANDIVSQGASRDGARSSVYAAVALCTEWDAKAGLVPRRCLLEGAS